MAIYVISEIALHHSNGAIFSAIVSPDLFGANFAFPYTIKEERNRNFREIIRSAYL
jgi:hypothetical protein